ncbi:hypothetical protein [Variovorax terrae]|uniref:Uncharacterized protein n=1 Tax=Variovorax terrae TaxID=2923278 RepID=A0A9X2AKM0_9BURK|nr:hypothetical protein [Variovorax terrae]MCJ0761628.1 hypothetical protein [Variovorax terrae]
MNHLQLYGLWRAEFAGEPQGAVLQLEKHPEFAESVKGTIRRDGAQAQVVGDVDEGVFTLEESIDGRNIAATWNGQVVEASCGKEIRGTWKNTANGAERAFILRKQPGWQ